jgi:hypothetical protein
MFIISLTSTPKRIDRFIFSLIDLIFNLQKCRDLHKIIINIPKKYRRFNEEIKLNKESKKILNKYKNKVIINKLDFDYGPLTKFIGGYRYLKSNNLHKCSIIIIDDDIEYNFRYINNLLTQAPSNYICAGSGFNIIDNNYIPNNLNNITYVEGFSGIHFPRRLINPLLDRFADLYKCLLPIDKRDKEDIPQETLLACFMGDDFIISYLHKKKLWTQNNWQGNIKVLEYGLGQDALQNNNLFNSNMGTYNYINENEIVLKTWINKIKLNYHFVDY